MKTPANRATIHQLAAIHNEEPAEMCIRIMDNCERQKDNVCSECDIDDICTLHKHSRQPENQEENMEARIKELQKIPMEERIKTARQEAEDAFWAVIVKHFPDATDGSFLMSDMDDIMLSWVNHWVDCNVPRPETVHRGDLYLLDELHLHYRDTWHLLHTGGGCMVALTDNVAVGGKYYYMGVTSECVCIYEDTFSEEQFMVEHITVWSFGDNPTVLMNQIDEFLGGTGYWDTGKLFDDIMTIGKSDKTM
jgi:hypothetical protein